MQEPRTKLTEQVNRFLDVWDRFYIDWWWRERHNVPFGSPVHRAQDFISMTTEFVEFKRIKQMRERLNEEQDKELMFGEDDDRVITPTKKEVIEDFENLDFTKFNKPPADG